MPNYNCDKNITQSGEIYNVMQTLYTVDCLMLKQLIVLEELCYNPFGYKEQYQKFKILHQTINRRSKQNSPNEGSGRKLCGKILVAHAKEFKYNATGDSVWNIKTMLNCNRFSMSCC